jgi:dipeptidyl aminopeptidase/acylaminoacyl peptidase
MKILITLFVCFTNIGSCIAQSNGHIISTSKVQFPSYESVKGIDFYYSKPVYEKAILNPKLKIEKIYYISEGLKVAAYLARPQEINNQKLPIIIFNRGSVIRNDIAYVHAPLFEKFVDSVFLVLAPALRQSEGSEGQDEVGGKDVNDIMNTVPLLSSLPYADTSRIYMYGESRGGMMTLQAIRENFPLKAAAIVGAFTDLALFIKDTPGMESVSKQIWSDYQENKEKILKRRSAIHWAEKINTPLLIMNGNKDPQVKPQHSFYLAEKLQTLGKKYQLIIYEGGNHILSGMLTEERDRQIISWFKRH